jgi:hypothetical protein
MGASNHARVLVAADDYYGSLATVRGLQAAGYEPWVATSHSATYAARSRAAAGVVLVPSPSAGADAFARRLAQAASDLRAAAIVPACEPALVALSGRASLFPRGVAVGTGDAATVARATDKGGNAGRAARGRRRRHPLARAAVSGRGLAAVAGVAWNGELVCAVHQVARRVYPRLGGSAYAETVAREALLEDQLAQLVRELRWSGIFHAQLIRNGRGSYLIDFNPRPYGTLALAIRASANLPAIWVDLLLGRRTRTVTYRTGIRFRSEPREARLVLGALRRRRVREALAPLVPRPQTAHAIFSLRDPAPLLFLVARAFRSLRR